MSKNSFISDQKRLPSTAEYSQVSSCGHLAITNTPLIRTAADPRRWKLQTFDWNNLSLLRRTLAITDLRTLSSVTAAQFYCSNSRYNGHQSATFNILDRITSNYNCLCSCVYMRRRAGPACRDPRCTSRDLSKCDSPPLIYTQRKVLREYKLRHEPSQPRLRVVPHFSSGMVERAKRERAWK